MNDPGRNVPQMVFVVNADLTDEELGELACQIVVEITLAARAEGLAIPTPQDLPPEYRALLEEPSTDSRPV